MGRKNFGRSVDDFIRLQQRKRIITREQDVCLKDLVDACAPVVIEDLTDLLDDFVAEKANPVASKIAATIKAAVTSLNRLNSARRLFALETINYLGSIENITTVLSTLGFAPQKELAKIANKFLAAFKGTDQVINTLMKSPHIFSEKTKDSQLHLLNNFRFELAKLLLSLFTETFIASKSKFLEIDREMELDLLRNIIRSSGVMEMESGMITGENLRGNLADALALIQSSNAVPLYAKLRSDYLKDFFMGLTKPGKVGGIKSSDMSKLAACFLYTNEQYKPTQLLVESMLDEERFNAVSTKKEVRLFLDELAPTTIDAILKDLHDFVRQLLSNPFTSLDELFEEARHKYEAGLPDDSLIGRVVGAMLDFKAIGILAVESLSHFFEHMVHDFHEPEETAKSLDDLFNEVTDLQNMARYTVIPRSQASMERVQDFLLVPTNVVGLRGEGSDGGKRAQSLNSQIFVTPENMDLCKPAFLTLFNHLRQTGETNIILHKFKHSQCSKREVNEYYAPFLIPTESDDPLLLCLGIGYFEKESREIPDNPDELQRFADSFMDPYCLLMSVSTVDTVISARSRKIKIESHLANREFKPVNTRKKEMHFALMQLVVDCMHLLPQSSWESESVQHLIGFCYDQLGISPGDLVPVKEDLKGKGDVFGSLPADYEMDDLDID